MLTRDEARETIEQQKQHRWLKAVRDVVPVAGIDRVFGELAETDALRAVQTWLPKCADRGLVLRGPCGNGKTLAAAFAVRAWTEPQIKRHWEMGYELLCEGHDVSWFHPDELVSAILHAYDRDAPELCRRVVVDDLGRETKPNFGEALCRLLDAADDGGNAHIVLITTNLTREQIRARYEPRLVERLNQRCVAVDVRGKSLRRDGGF